MNLRFPGLVSIQRAPRSPFSRPVYTIRYNEDFQRVTRVHLFFFPLNPIVVYPPFSPQNSLGPLYVLFCPTCTFARGRRTSLPPERRTLFFIRGFSFLFPLVVFCLGYWPGFSLSFYPLFVKVARRSPPVGLFFSSISFSSRSAVPASFLQTDSTLFALLGVRTIFLSSFVRFL